MDLNTDQKITNNSNNKTKQVQHAPVKTTSPQKTVPKNDNKTNSCCIQLISLNALVYTICIFLLQLYIIIGRFRSLKDYNLISWSPYTKPEECIGFYAFFVTIAIVFTILFLLCGSIRLGNYGHDDIKLGKDFDDTSSTFSSIVSNDLSPNKEQKTSKNPFVKYNLLKNNVIWKRFPPIAQFLHIVSAFCLLYPELIMSKKRIEYGFKPIGDVFSTKLDFLFGEPIDRIEKSNISNTIVSKDDFSSLATNSINLDILNFMIALIVFSLKISQTFWHTSRTFSLFSIIYTFSLTLQSIISYCSFQIVYKSQLFSQIRAQLLFDNNLFSLVYIISSLIIFKSSIIIVNFGYVKYQKLIGKFESNLYKYFIQANQQTIIKKENCEVEAACSSSSSSSSSSGESTSTENEKNANTSGSDLKQIEKNKPSVLFHYKEHIILSFLFFIYCFLRSFFIYEMFTVCKYSFDFVLIISICIEFVVILIWVISLILITIDIDWSFKLESSYKLINWSWLHELKSKGIYVKSSNISFDNTRSSIISGLLVRDDSVLNGSIQSASITDVSYVPVTGTGNLNVIKDEKRPRSVIISKEISEKTYTSKPPRLPTVDDISNSINKLEANMLSYHQNETNKSLFVQKCDSVDSNYSKCIILNPNKIGVDANREQNYQYVSGNTEPKIYQRSYYGSQSHRIPKTISFDTNVIRQLDPEKHVDVIALVRAQQLNYNSQQLFQQKPIPHLNIMQSKDVMRTSLKADELIAATSLPKTVTQSPLSPIQQACTINASANNKTILFVDSSSATDSGRDSLNESPVSNKPPLPNTSTSNNQTTATTTTNKGKPTSGISLLDTRC